MEDKVTGTTEENAPVRKLTDAETAKVAGGHSHGRIGSFRCSRCGLQLPDAAAYYEHQKMAHSE